MAKAGDRALSVFSHFLHIFPYNCRINSIQNKIISIISNIGRIEGNSIEAHVGCIAGVSKKDEYIKDMKAAGFSRVEIMEENVFPLEGITDDPTAGWLLENLKISQQRVKEISDTISTFRFSAVKPA